LKRTVVVILVITLVLLLDQSSKIWVKTHMEYGEYFKIFDLEWARIHFVENPGMAFGLELDVSYGKLLLSLFRIVAVGFLIYYLSTLIKAKSNLGLLICFSLILAGAIGNIIDSAFYGIIFSESYPGTLSRMFPSEGGYATFLHGKVVDMLYFPLVQGYYPDWLPMIGGRPFLFFKPVFNVADSAITSGVLSILLFQRSFFSSPTPTQKEISTAPQEETKN